MLEELKIKISLLSAGEVWGNEQLNVFRKVGTAFEANPLVPLTGGYTSREFAQDQQTCWVYTKDSATIPIYGGQHGIRVIRADGTPHWYLSTRRHGAIVPVIDARPILDYIKDKIVTDSNGVQRVELGHYITEPASAEEAEQLNKLYQQKNIQDSPLKVLSRTYTFDSRRPNEETKAFEPISYNVINFKDKNYIRLIANPNFLTSKEPLNNGKTYESGDYVWMQEEPVSWLYDEKSQKLISEKALVSGIRFTKEPEYDGNFEETEINSYLKIMANDMFRDVEFIKKDSIINQEPKDTCSYEFVYTGNNNREESNSEVKSKTLTKKLK